MICEVLRLFLNKVVIILLLMIIVCLALSAMYSCIELSTSQYYFVTKHKLLPFSPQLPSVCVYQTAYFVIELSAVNFEDDNTLEIFSSNYTGRGFQVPLTLDSDLTANESYSLKVTVITVAGNSSVYKNFSEYNELQQS